MNTTHVKQVVLVTVIVAGGASGIAVAAASGASQAAPASTPTGGHAMQHQTPSDCIQRNGGDWNACNVGHSGRGDAPFRITRPRTPDECILINAGDYNACAVGNDSRGDLPYKPVR